ncbi:12219_t:CDS:1, partial [Gigaspora margarita]
MRVIYFLLILLSILQSHSIYAQRYHPLANLWEVDDTEVPEYLEFEKNLTAIDEILRPILEQDDFISSFGGTSINIFENHIVVNTVNYSKVDDLLALPQITPHKAFLFFKKTNNSMSLLKHNFYKISSIAQIIHPKRVLIYIGMEYNNVVLYFLGHNINNTEFIDAVKSFNPTIIYEGSSPPSQNIIRPQ